MMQTLFAAGYHDRRLLKLAACRSIGIKLTDKPATTASALPDSPGTSSIAWQADALAGNQAGVKAAAGEGS